MNFKRVVPVAVCVWVWVEGTYQQKMILCARLQIYYPNYCPYQCKILLHVPFNYCIFNSSLFHNCYLWIGAVQLNIVYIHFSLQWLFFFLLLIVFPLWTCVFPVFQVWTFPGTREEMEVAIYMHMTFAGNWMQYRL